MESTVRQRGPGRFSVLVICLAGTLGLTGCRSRPSTTAITERAQGSDAGKKIQDGWKALMDACEKPADSFHFSYKAQKNVNPKYPMDKTAKPEVGPEEIEADISPEEINLKETHGTKKSSASAKKSDQLGWATAQLSMLGALGGPGIAMGYASAVARPAGSENVGTVSADKYEFDTSTASASQKTAYAMMQGMFNYTGVKGAAWVDKKSGRLVKFNLDTDLSDKAGNSWKEHDEGEVTPK